MIEFMRAAASASVCAALLAACGGGSGGADTAGSANTRPTTATPFSNLQNIAESVAPAVVGGPYSAALSDCVFNPNRIASCTLAQLPFIGSNTEAIAVDDVMRHVITSKPWMAQRLREVLSTLPADLLQMLRPVTAIVVTGKIRPSHYWGMTGAIYIDPRYIWTTPEELADVDKTQDYRTNYGNDLQFLTLWRYVKDDDYAYKGYSLKYTGSRSIDDLKLAFAHLITHEATHAGDYAPPQLLATLPLDKPLNIVLSQISDQGIAKRLLETSPLTSPLWKSVAQVKYGGSTASTEIAAMTAANVASAFSSDRATDDYAYINVREDAAMLAEEALMRIYFGVERDFAISPRPALANPTTADYIVTWGTRGRIGNSESKHAASLVLANLFPNRDFSTALDAIPLPKALPPGTSWQNSLVLNTGTRASANKKRATALDDSRPVAEDLLRPQ